MLTVCDPEMKLKQGKEVEGRSQGKAVGEGIFSIRGTNDAYPSPHTSVWVHAYSAKPLLLA